MNYRIISFFLQFVLFYNQYGLIHTLIGPNTRRVQRDEFNYVAGFIEIIPNISIRSRLWCSGTFITVVHVLTSDHCFNDLVGNHPFRVVAGSNRLSRCTYYYPSWWISYNQWTAQYNIPLQHRQNDIAILSIVQNMAINIIPAPLLMDAVNTRLYGLNVTIAAWGKIEEDRVPSIMRAATAKVLTKTECDTIVSSIEGVRIRLETRFLCTKAEPYAYLGEGDSGGPLLFEGSVVAINKGICPSNFGRFHPDTINVHLDIYPYADFIDVIMSEHH